MPATKKDAAKKAATSVQKTKSAVVRLAKSPAAKAKPKKANIILI
jgi:hypothetical protein